jgi:hydrogenase expression/formation protein HypC
MCLAVPGKIVEILDGPPVSRQARVNFSGIVKAISLALLPDARVGQFVLVHAGVAIGVVNEAEAQRTLDYLKEIDEIEAPGDPAQ